MEGLLSNLTTAPMTGSQKKRGKMLTHGCGNFTQDNAAVGGGGGGGYLSSQKKQ